MKLVFFLHHTLPTATLQTALLRGNYTWAIYITVASIHFYTSAGDWREITLKIRCWGEKERFSPQEGDCSVCVQTADQSNRNSSHVRASEAGRHTSFENQTMQNCKETIKCVTSGKIAWLLQWSIWIWFCIFHLLWVVCRSVWVEKTDLSHSIPGGFVGGEISFYFFSWKSDLFSSWNFWLETLRSNALNEGDIVVHPVYLWNTHKNWTSVEGSSVCFRISTQKSPLNCTVVSKHVQLLV